MFCFGWNGDYKSAGDSVNETSDEHAAARAQSEVKNTETKKPMSLFTPVFGARSDDSDSDRRMVCCPHDVEDAARVAIEARRVSW